MSLIESSASVIAGYLITVLIQYWLYPLFGIEIPVGDAFLISVIIVLAAFLKNFTVRRIFNSIHTRPEISTESEPVDAANANNAASVNLNQSARIR